MPIRRGSNTEIASKLIEAIYHKQRGRVYRQTREEKQTGTLQCPKCKEGFLSKQPYTRSTKIYICDNCGFKITTDKIIASEMLEQSDKQEADKMVFNEESKSGYKFITNKLRELAAMLMAE